MFFSKRERNILWNNLEIINNYYSMNDYKYKIYFAEDNKLIQYLEILNGSVIYKLEFDIKENYHWHILIFCNKEVRTLGQIIEYFNLQDTIVEQENIKKALIELNKEFLLYSNSEFTENITIINTDFVL
jgi:hypothetical protein